MLFTDLTIILDLLHKIEIIKYISDVYREYPFTLLPQAKIGP